MEVDVRNPTPIQPPPEIVAGHRDSHHGHYAAVVWVLSAGFTSASLFGD
jgi:hypothetical protein